MKFAQAAWNEVREVAWLASMVGGLSILGVALAVVLALALDTWAAGLRPFIGHV